MSPETLVTGDYMNLTVDNMLSETPLDIPEQTTITPNGALYRTDKKGFLPEMMQDIYDDRTIFKKKMLKAKQDYEDTKDPKVSKVHQSLQQHSDGKKDFIELCLWCDW